MKELIVIKIGTDAITQSDGEIDETILSQICQQIAILHKEYRIIVVSSGAVGAGKKYLKEYNGKIEAKKAAAAIGNPILIRKYAQYLETQGIFVAQVLNERQHFSNRQKFVQFKKTFTELWKNDIVTIVNENDVISDHEIKFSDNDELASLIAIGFSAEKLLLGTSVAGLLDVKTLVPKIEKFDKKIFGLVTKETSANGLGGMHSKLHFARTASEMGIHTVIFNIKEDQNIIKAINEETGTQCMAQACKKSNHQKWLASGGIISARVFVDEGAQKALQDRKSLLLVGVTKIEGNFEKGEIFKIFGDPTLPALAVAKTKYDSQEICNKSDKKGIVLAHANEIFLY